MKVIGLIGGMTWESTLEYYRIINEEVKKRLGGYYSAKILMFSVDFHEIEEHQRAGRWDDSARILADAAQRLEKGGADFVLLCCNTMYKVAPQIEKAVGIPLLHIADATAEEAKRLGISVLGRLGTKFTMEQDFLRERFTTNHGLKVLVPNEESQNVVHTIIYNELCHGIVLEKSRDRLLGIIDDLGSRGAKGIILGCTELPMLIWPHDTTLPLFDTGAIHARKAVDRALEK